MGTTEKSSFAGWFSTTNVRFATVVLSALACLLTALAVGLPQWIVFGTAIQHRFGLFKICSTATCEDHNYVAAVAGSACGRTGDGLSNRMDTSSMLLFIGIVLLSIFTICTFYCNWFQSPISKRGFGGMCFLIFGAAFAFMVAVSLFYATVNRWLFCGESFCTAMELTNCSYGLPFIVAICFVPGILLVAVLFVFGRLQMQQSGRSMNKLLFVMCLFGTALALWSLFSPRWVVWDDATASEGLWAWCNETECTKFTYPEGVTFETRPGCVRKYRDLRRRNAVSGALLILSLCFSAAFCLLFLCARGKVLSKLSNDRGTRNGVTICIGADILLEASGSIVYVNTINSWRNCGQSFCTEKDHCQYGISAFAVALSLVALVLTLLLHIASLCLSTASSEGSEARQRSARQPSSSPRRPSPASTAGGSKPRKLPSGEWMHDSNSGYYWSESRNEFWDSETGYTYNPDIGQWKDPETGQFV